MSNIRSIDMIFIEDLLDMGGGYVLNFTDRTFAQFFAEELNVDIDNPRYAQTGGSKGKRLRFLFQTVDKPTVVRILKSLWIYREAILEHTKEADQREDEHGRLVSLSNQL